MTLGPEAALAVIDPLVADPALADYPYLPSVRADFLAKLVRFAEAKLEVERASNITKNVRERSLLSARAAAYTEAQTASHDKPRT